MARCAINPQTMQSKKYKIQPAPKAKSVAVVGGGIAGMEAAIVCARRGHQVTLYEKTGTLGGVFQAAAAPSFKEKDRELLAWYSRELGKYKNLKVKLNATVENLDSLKADEVIIATGAKANTIPVPGKELGIQAVDYLLGRNSEGENVVVEGGGLTGCEIA